MSNNSEQYTGSDSLHETADEIVRDILNITRISTDASSVSPSGELYRHIEQFHYRRRREAAMAEHRRRQLQDDASEESPLFVLPLQPQATSPPHERPAGSPARAPGSFARRSRRQILAGDRYRARVSTQRESGLGNSLAELQHAGRQLEAASSTLRALLDDPVPNIPHPAIQAQEYSSEAEHNRRAKRRKLDTDRLDSGFRGFSYGKYGQVEPGTLKMEIVSCDGGIYQDHGGDYSAENVLRSDNTVYCTKSNRCNLVLRHQGATVFSLKELVIKAPHSGYTAPIQEGMVFISMSSDDLLTRTAQYQIQYSPARRSLPPAVVSIRHNTDGSMTAQARARRLYDIGVQDEECDYRTAQIPSDFTTNASLFQVTTEFSDSEDEDDDNDGDVLPGLTAAAPGDHETSDDDIHGSRPWHEDFLLGSNREARQERTFLPTTRRRETASNITLAEAVEASQLATQEAVRAVGGELMAPHARFFIERDKSKYTVRFDPPVSGRFILLKMWSPQQGPEGNIDIQSVVARGWAGTRFFPAMKLR